MARDFENFKAIKFHLAHRLNDPNIRIRSNTVLKLKINTVDKEDYLFYCMDHYLFIYIY